MTQPLSQGSPVIPAARPIEFNKGLVFAAVETLLASVGDPNPKRPGMADTPARMVRAWAEWTSGYRQDPHALLTVFEDGAENYDAMVIVHGVPIVSQCEHHLAPFHGYAHIAYVPNGRVVGLSKLARLADVFARRLQVQERLTTQIASTLHESPVKPRGVGVLVRATHTCMSSRGVKVHGNATTTSALTGVFLEPAVRAEFLQLCAMAEQGEP